MNCVAFLFFMGASVAVAAEERLTPGEKLDFDVAALASNGAEATVEGDWIRHNWQNEAEQGRHGIRKEFCDRLAARAASCAACAMRSSSSA